MKVKTMIILSFMLLAACNSENRKKHNWVKGVYVTHYENEYSKAIDTIEITPLNEKAGTFHYARRTGYRRKSNGAAGPHQYKTEHSTCVYNEATAQLHEQRHGRVYSISADGESLTSGNSIYKRIQ